MTLVEPRARLAGCLLVLAAAAACGSPEKSSKTDIDELQPRVRIGSFEVAPRSIDAGESATLAWTTENAASIAIADASGQLLPLDGLDPARGEVTVSPAQTTSYTLTASGAPGTLGPAYRTVTLEVEPGGEDAPVIEAFEASAAAVPVGSPVTLSWRVTGATSLTLRDDAAVATDLTGTSVTDGSVQVRPERSPTRYTLTATGNGRTASAQVEVDVLGLPRIHRFSVDPREPVAPGTAVELVWDTSRAERIVIRDDADAIVFDGTEPLSGRFELTLDRTTEYELTAIGAGGESSATALARVGATIEDFSATPRIARAGDPITLSWTVAHAEAVTITGPGGFVHDATAAELAAGSLVVNLPESGDYVLAARLGAVTQTWSIYVEVTQAPRVRSLTADENPITAAPDHVETVTLSFVQDGGASCTLLRDDLVVPGFDHFACGRSGTLDVQLTGTADLRLVATNGAGGDDAQVHVDAIAPARIPTFTATPDRRLAPGDTVSLAWEVTDAVLVRMERNGAPFAIGATEFVGTRSDVIDFDTVFTLSSENALGHVTSVPVSVFAGVPVIAQFQVTPAVAVPGDAVTIEWVCDGGDSLVLTDAGGLELANLTDPASIDEGSVETVAAATPGTYVYTLTLRNAAGQVVTTTVDLVVTDGPLIRSLTASKTQISLGGTVNLTWNVTDDLAGTDPTLALVDDFGNTYDLTGLNPNAGTVTITPPEEGRHTFTLTATATAGTRPSTRTVAVEVTVAPKILSFTASPPVAFTEGGSVVPTVDLAWQTQNGVELAIYETDADGQPIGPAIHRISLATGGSQADIDASSTAVGPTVTTKYLLRVHNRIGSTVDRLLTVLVDPPRIGSFAADPVDIILGEGAALSWETENATLVTLRPMEPVVTEVANGFVDISALPGVVPIPLTANDSYELINFPPDFRFPFDGVLMPGMRVTTNGFISFDLAGSGASTSNQSSFPTSSTYSYVHLAPYWDSLATYTVGTMFWRWDDVARTMTVMWKNWSYRTTTAPTDLNFEVVLHENGNFEYHYGTMFGGLSSSGTDYQYYADGAYATIGFQNTANNDGYLFHYGSSSTTGRFPGGFTNRGWSFNLARPIDGTWTVTPATNRTYTLVARNADLEATATADVRVWPVPVINVASIYPSGPQTGVPFEISWRNTNATRLRVLDPHGAVLCEQTDPALVAQGSCMLTVATAGSQSVTLQVINGIARNVVTRQVNFVVFPRLSIESFHATKTFATSGEQVTISWAGTGGFEAELYACVPKTNHGSCTPIDITGQDPNSGSYTTTMTQSREFWFRLVDRLYRSEEATANVWVDAPTLDSFTSSSTQVAPGTSVTLDWSSTGAGAATVQGVPNPLEVTTTRPYADISATGTAGTRSGTNDSGYYQVNFPAGFRFPYFGTQQAALRASIDGWVTFDTAYTTAHATNYSMPTSTTYQKVSLAPFWDSLVMKATGSFYYELRTGTDGVRYLILQWTGLEFSSSTYNPANLNFQVVLYENGNLEYRYGTMTSSTSYPGYAAGQSATIGYQNYDVTIGKLLTTAYNTAMDGGLANRSWLFYQVLPADGQIAVVPDESTTYRVCVTNQSLYDACQDIRVVVVKPGDLMISEVMIAPAVADGEWFEVRNLARDPIDLSKGFSIASGASESFTVPAGQPLIVQPNAYLVLARSGDPATNGGVSPALVYGSAIDLGDTTDEVQLKLGTTPIDRVVWAASWPIQANKSIAFEPALFNRDETANNAVDSWCASSAVYGGGFAGSPGAIGAGCFNTGGYQYYQLDPYAGMPFIDIALTGTQVAGLFSTPYWIGPIPLGFAFPYFGDVVTEMNVTRLGYVTLEPITATPSTSNSAIDPPTPSTLPNGIVAPFWDTHYDRGTATITYELRPVGGHLVMVIQWTDLTPASSSDYGYVTFQTQLWDSGDIVFAYKDLRPSTTSATYAGYWYIYGSGSTIGLESIAGSSSIQIFYGSSSTAGKPLYDGRSYRFKRK